MVGNKLIILVGIAGLILSLNTVADDYSDANKVCDLLKSRGEVFDCRIKNVTPIAFEIQTDTEHGGANRICRDLAGRIKKLNTSSYHWRVLVSSEVGKWRPMTFCDVT